MVDKFCRASRSHAGWSVRRRLEQLDHRMRSDVLRLAASVLARVDQPSMVRCGESKRLLHLIKLRHIFDYTASRRKRDHQGQARPQGRSPEANRFAQPAPRAGACRALPAQRLLRPARSRAGEVRDAARGRSRGCLQGSGGGLVRRVASDLLPGAAGLHARRAGRPVAAAARAQRRAQGDRRGSGLHCPAPSRRSGPARQGAGRGLAHGVASRRASAQHRTRAGAEKKR